MKNNLGPTCTFARTISCKTEKRDSIVIGDPQNDV